MLCLTAILVFILLKVALGDISLLLPFLLSTPTLPQHRKEPQTLLLPLPTWHSYSFFLPFLAPAPDWQAVRWHLSVLFLAKRSWQFGHSNGFSPVKTDTGICKCIKPDSFLSSLSSFPLSPLCRLINTLKRHGEEEKDTPCKLYLC